MSSWELKNGDSKYLETNGKKIVIFRGEDGIVYALSAFCGHMGANLGLGGQVKWKSCIECPFHSWTYNVYYLLKYLGSRWKMRKQ